MASAKSSSRTRAAHPSSQSKATANKLEENLNVFKSDHFDADGYVQTKCNSLNEKVVSSFLFFFFFLLILVPLYYVLVFSSLVWRLLL